MSLAQTEITCFIVKPRFMIQPGSMIYFTCLFGWIYISGLLFISSLSTNQPEKSWAKRLSDMFPFSVLSNSSKCVFKSRLGLNFWRSLLISNAFGSFGTCVCVPLCYASLFSNLILHSRICVFNVKILSFLTPISCPFLLLF